MCNAHSHVQWYGRTSIDDRNLMSAEYLSMDLKETELTLRPPGSIYSKSSPTVHHHHHHHRAVVDGRFNLFKTSSSSSCCSSSSMKRGFMETVDHADLKSSTSCCETRGMIKVDGKLEDAHDHCHKYSSSTSSDSSTTAVTQYPHAKAGVIGWPPVRSTRQKAVAAESSCRSNGEMSNKYVKVSADGAPYLRKLDLEMYKSYHQLSRALDQMFTSPFIISGKCVEEDGNEVLKDGVKGVKMDEYHHHHHRHHHYVLTYEDKDGDWMLVGDVPWKMFIESCKRIRLMKSSEAVGIAPRTTQTLPK